MPVNVHFRHLFCPGWRPAEISPVEGMAGITARYLTEQHLRAPMARDAEIEPREFRLFLAATALLNAAKVEGTVSVASAAQRTHARA